MYNIYSPLLKLSLFSCPRHAGLIIVLIGFQFGDTIFIFHHCCWYDYKVLFNQICSDRDPVIGYLNMFLNVSL